MLNEDRNTLIVASREYGVYLIDVHDSQNPMIIGHIDTLELASGMDVCGKYLFVASRIMNEIYDISIPSNPELSLV